MARKVLMLLTNCFDPDPRVHMEARTLTEHGDRVTILGWDRDVKRPREERIEDIRVQRIHLRSTHGRGTAQVPFLLAFWALALIEGLRQDFDVVHCHDLDTLPLGLVLGRIRRKKVVFDAHESFPDMLAGNVPNGLRKVLRLMEDILVRRVDALLTVGELLRREYQGRGARATYVVGNWKRLEDYALSAQQAIEERRRLGIPDDKLVITYIAWLSQERRLGALLEAVEKGQGIFLLIGGDGPLREEVQRRSRDRRNIRYLGYVDPSQVPLYTAVADVIYYGFDPANPNAQYSAPNKLFEALAAGKAVITGRFGEIADIVQRERCGLCLPSLTRENIADAFQTLRQRGILKCYQQNAERAGQERYNWPRAAQELLRAYERLGIGRDGRGSE